MGLFSMLKRNSKLALRGNWGRAIIILLIMAGVSSIITAFTQIAIGLFIADPMANVPTMEHYDTFTRLAEELRLGVAEWVIFGVTTILSIFITAPLALGAARWYHRLVHGEGTPVTEIFYYFETGKSYARAIFYEINIYIRSLLWSVLFHFPPAAVLGVALFFLSGNEELTRTGRMTATFGVIISVVLLIIASVFYAVCICRYTLTPYLLAGDPDLTVRKAIKLSVKYTKGYRFSIFGFGLSYIGWFLLLVFFFPILYVMPYYSTSIAMYSRFIIEKSQSLPPAVTQEFTADTGEPDAEETDAEESGTEYDV